MLGKWGKSIKSNRKIPCLRCAEAHDLYNAITAAIKMIIVLIAMFVCPTNDYDRVYKCPLKSAHNLCPLVLI